jgi:hypothetical protein
MAYPIDPRRISHERLADEVIIINVTSGAYFAGSGTAADQWTLNSQAASSEESPARLAAVYGADRQTVSDHVNACVAMLLERGVLQPENGRAEPGAALTLPDMQRGPWTAPVFQEHLDMWDLIQLDPIHDVGDAGWPFAAPAPRT